MVHDNLVEQKKLHFVEYYMLQEITCWSTLIRESTLKVPKQREQLLQEDKNIGCASHGEHSLKDYLKNQVRLIVSFHTIILDKLCLLIFIPKSSTLAKYHLLKTLLWVIAI